MVEYLNENYKASLAAEWAAEWADEVNGTVVPDDPMAAEWADTIGVEGSCIMTGCLNDAVPDAGHDVAGSSWKYVRYIDADGYMTMKRVRINDANWLNFESDASLISSHLENMVPSVLDDAPRVTEGSGDDPRSTTDSCVSSPDVYDSRGTDMSADDPRSNEPVLADVPRCNVFEPEPYVLADAPRAKNNDAPGFFTKVCRWFGVSTGCGL